MEEESFILEKKIIKECREKGFKLCNLTDGGDGISGYTHRDETKQSQKISAYFRSFGSSTKGVSFDNRCVDKGWASRITLTKGKRKYLGYFKTQLEAIGAYYRELKIILGLSLTENNYFCSKCKTIMNCADSKVIITCSCNCAIIADITT